MSDKDVLGAMYIACADQRIEDPDRGIDAMRDAAKVLIEDMREWGTPVYTEQTYAFYKTLDAYAKAKGIYK